MDWDKFMAASIIALGLSPAAKDRLIPSSRGATRSANRIARKRRVQLEHAVDAYRPAKSKS
jgi:hypothetical protein